MRIRRKLLVALAVLGYLGSSLAAFAGGTDSPQPGAAFEGTIAIHGKASSGTITFTLLPVLWKCYNGRR